MSVRKLVSGLTPYKTLIRWMGGITFAAIVGTWSFFTIKTDYLDRLKTLEKTQEEHTFILEDIRSEIQISRENTTTHFRHLYERIEADLDKQTKETNRKLELIIKYREMDKELLIDMLSLSRAIQTPMIMARDTLDLKIGIRKK